MAGSSVEGTFEENLLARAHETHARLRAMEGVLDHLLQRVEEAGRSRVPSARGQNVGRKDAVGAPGRDGEFAITLLGYCVIFASAVYIFLDHDPDYTSDTLETRSQFPFDLGGLVVSVALVLTIIIVSAYDAGGRKNTDVVRDMQDQADVGHNKHPLLALDLTSDNVISDWLSALENRSSGAKSSERVDHGAAKEEVVRNVSAGSGILEIDEHIVAGRLKEASGALRKFEASQYDTADYLWRKSRVLLLEGDHLKHGSEEQKQAYLSCLEYAKKAVAADRCNARAYEALSCAIGVVTPYGDTKAQVLSSWEIIAACEKAIDLDPSLPLPYHGLGYVR